MGLAWRTPPQRDASNLFRGLCLPLEGCSGELRSHCASNLGLSFWPSIDKTMAVVLTLSTIRAYETALLLLRQWSTSKVSTST